MVLILFAITYTNALWRNPDKEYIVVPVAYNEYFDDVDCSNYQGQTFERGLYYDGTACENVGLILHKHWRYSFAFSRALLETSTAFVSSGSGTSLALATFLRFAANAGTPII